MIHKGLGGSTCQYRPSAGSLSEDRIGETLVPPTANMMMETVLVKAPETLELFVTAASKRALIWLGAISGIVIFPMRK